MVVGLLLCTPRRHERLEFLARIFLLVLKVPVIRRLVTRAVLQEHLIIIFFAIFFRIIRAVVALVHRLGIAVAGLAHLIIVSLDHHAVIVWIAAESLTRPRHHKAKLPLGFTDPGEAHPKHRLHALRLVHSPAAEKHLRLLVVRKPCASEHLAGQLLVGDD